MAGTITCQNCKAEVQIPDGHISPFIKCSSCQKMNNVPISFRSTKSAAALPARPAPLRPPAPPARPAPLPPSSPPARPAPGIAPRPLTSGAFTPPPSARPFAASPQPRPSPQPTVGPAGDLGDLPELMKANKRLAGRSCPICSAPIQMGDPVHNCPNCRQPSHQECWNKNNGCGSGPCQASAPSLLPSLPHQPAPPQGTCGPPRPATPGRRTAPARDKPGAMPLLQGTHHSGCSQMQTLL